MKRSYRHRCSLAQALDLVGERWSLLLVHELLLGPQRFKELLEALSGIGTKLLTDRLRALEDANILRRRFLPPPAASTVYELTDVGEALVPAIVALSKWGATMLPDGPLEEVPPLRCGALWVRYVMFRPELARGVRETYEFRAHDDVFHLSVDDGRAEARLGRARHPDVVVSSDAQTFWAIARGQLQPMDALATGRVAVEGQLDVLLRALEILGLPGPDMDVTDASVRPRRALPAAGDGARR